MCGTAPGFCLHNCLGVEPCGSRLQKNLCTTCGSVIFSCQRATGNRSIDGSFPLVLPPFLSIFHIPSLVPSLGGPAPRLLPRSSATLLPGTWRVIPCGCLVARRRKREKEPGGNQRLVRSEEDAPDFRVSRGPVCTRRFLHALREVICALNRKQSDAALTGSSVAAHAATSVRCLEKRDPSTADPVPSPVPRSASRHLCALRRMH